MSNIRKDLLTRGRVSRLNYGVHDNCVITAVDLEDRKRKGQLEKKIIYITFATVDPETKKRKSEVELSWFRFDFTSEYIFSNIREICVQLHGILTCYMTEDEAFEALATLFDGFEFKSVDDIENHKWKKKEVDTFTEKLKLLFGQAIKDNIGLDKSLIRVKVTTDNKGEYANIPKFGVFTEPMSVEKTALQFSNYELKNHSKAGTVNGAADTADLLKQL